jgi:hypothetical protein
VLRRFFQRPGVKRRLTRLEELCNTLTCGVFSSSVPDSTEDIVADLSAANGGSGGVGAGGGKEHGGEEQMHKNTMADAGALKRIEEKLVRDMDLTLQCLLQLSKEVRGLSYRVKHLTETEDQPALFS